MGLSFMEKTADELRKLQANHRDAEAKAKAKAAERHEFAKSADDPEAARRAMVEKRDALREAEDEATLAASYDARIANAEKRQEGKRVDGIETRAKQRQPEHERQARRVHKAALTLKAELAKLADMNAEHDADKRELQAAGRTPIESGERLARVVPGRKEPAIYEDRVAWLMPDGSPATFHVRDPETGEMRPQSVHARKERQRVCVREERNIAPQYAESLADTVFLPGWLPTDEPAWPGKGRR